MPKLMKILYKVITSHLNIIILGYINGSVLLKHPSIHDFRTKTDKPNVYNRKYEPSVDRANRIAQENNEAILEKLRYNENEPRRKYFLRPRVSLDEI
jgi:hypothetical protein